MFGAQAALLPKLCSTGHRYIGALTTHKPAKPSTHVEKHKEAFMAQDVTKIDAILNLAPVVPVLTLDDPETAIAVGRALVSGGLPGLEV
ncbi:hypothetical protein ACVIJ6_000620 [Bradyrhizobium sp. USDA 4369]